MSNKAQSKKKRPATNKLVKPVATQAGAPAPALAAEPAAKAESKIGKVIMLLRRTGGATLPEIVEATGWQPHSARAALTGLKKKGHSLERAKRDESTCYRIVEGGRS